MSELHDFMQLSGPCSVCTDLVLEWVTTQISHTLFFVPVVLLAFSVRICFASMVIIFLLAEPSF